MKLLLLLLAIVVCVTAVVCLLGFSWFVVCGITYLICLCFDWTFSLGAATGVWLIVMSVRALLQTTRVGRSRRRFR